MNFISFLTRIFAFFHVVLEFISSIFDLLFNNNLIKLSLCIGVFVFIIEYNFEIIHLLPRILGFANEQEKEFETKSVSVTSSERLKDSVITRSHNITKRKRLK